MFGLPHMAGRANPKSSTRSGQRILVDGMGNALIAANAGTAGADDEVAAIQTDKARLGM
jgi:hypothetical protein